tara:strand:+ start:87 stop:371 length:285 start_codon:yes stop_codon:yes gene_type:complete
MIYYVYLILSKKNNNYISYVGYTNNIKKRLELHNKSKGAKFTKGRTWIVIYFKKYRNKTSAMKEEFKLKKNYKLRNKIKEEYLEKNENCNITSF